MNLLNNLFNSDDIIIKKTNKCYLIISITIIVIVGCLLLIKVNKYYINNYNIIDNSIILTVFKDNINDIKTTKEIILNEIKENYNINTITQVNDNYLVNISIKTTINNLSDGKYKIYLGKERLFDYIIRIIKK